MICTKCGINKQSSEFRSRKQNGRVSPIRMCKSCLTKQRHDWYHKNGHQGRRTVRNSTRRRMLEDRKFLLDYLSSHPCVDCGQTNIIVLEFDHVSGNKKYKVAKMVMRGMSIKSIQEEISKCEVRCANCHRIKHAKQFHFWYANV